MHSLFNRKKVEGKIMLVRRAEIKDIEKINELLLQVAMVHHYGRPDLFKANCRKYKNDELVEIIKTITVRYSLQKMTELL